MKHIKLFEGFNNEQLMFAIDPTEEFPDMYTGGEDGDLGPDEQKTNLEVYLLKGDTEISTDNSSYSHIDPSFNTEKVKLKLVLNSTDSFGYGAENIIYIGLPVYSRENVLRWFSEMLNNPNMDYMSY
jgi:hypothetical protein